MCFGKAAGYAVLATVRIANRQHKGLVRGRTIAADYPISKEYLLKILQRLVRAGVLTSQTGRKGGFQLAKPSAMITLLEVVEAVEGPIKHKLPRVRGADRDRAALRALEEIGCGVRDHCRKLLERTTIDELTPGH